jgi:hypothetical protein
MGAKLEAGLAQVDVRRGWAADGAKLAAGRARVDGRRGWGRGVLAGWGIGGFNQPAVPGV